MSVPLPVSVSHNSLAMDRSQALPSPSFDLFSRYNSFGSGCALTILRGSAEQSIGPHTPIYKKAADVTASSARPRFAGSFAKPAGTPKPADSSLTVHAVSDHGVLLPFLDRPSEVQELLFQTKTNEPLMHRLCRTFGGDIHAPIHTGLDERWDEMLELLDTDRPILDDEDWLVRIESLVMERSPELWAQLSRCLGADGLTCSTSSRRSRFDSWAPSSSSDDNENQVLSPSEDEHMPDEADFDVDVAPLQNVPATFSKQPAKMQQSSLHEFVALPSSDTDVPLSPSQTSDSVCPMSYNDATAAASLADIMEEPGKSTSISQASVTRTRSQSGRFAALRISAMPATSPASSRRSSELSTSRPLSAAKDRSLSPLTSDLALPSETHLGSALDATDLAAPASFSRHRRLSTMIVNPSTPENGKQLLESVPASPGSCIAHRPDVTTETEQPSYAAPSAGRRRAQSFARSFAGLSSPLQTDASSTASPRQPSDAPALAESSDSNGTSPAPVGGRKRRDSDSGSSTSSSPILGLLPDGRTRHPSGSCGSKDLTESVAAFRATMGLSTSPTPQAPNLDDMDDASSNSGTTTRKRKGTGAERPQLSAITDAAAPKVSAEAKVLRVQGPDASHAEKSVASTQKPYSSQQQHKGASTGSGLALGGGFSLAKSGANFRKQSPEASRPLPEKFSFHSPPSVRRRPGGFASLANEYDFARRSRRATNESVFSMNSNALGSSPSSSVGSFDFSSEHRRSSSEDLKDRSTPSVQEPLTSATTDLPEIVATGPTPSGTPGAVTPRASIAESSPQLAETRDDYFPAAIRKTQQGSSSPRRESQPRDISSAVNTRNQPSYLSPPTNHGGWQGTGLGPRSPTLVFPISSNPAVSRARELAKALETPACQEALAQIDQIATREDAASIRELIGNTERAHMSDEALLEAVGSKLGLVDHERAHQLGGRTADEADQILAQDGYDQRWHAFSGLCKALGVGQYEISTAKRRCGPAIDLSSSNY